MLSRVADSLYWMSRYLERAEHTARVINIQLNLMLERESQSEDLDWERVGRSLGMDKPDDDLDKDPDKDEEWKTGSLAQSLLHDASNRSSIVASIVNARENARQVREQISSEMWEQLNRLFHQVKQDDEVGDVRDFLYAIRDGAHLFQGITDSTMTHGEGWQFIQTGRFLERTVAVAMLVGVHFGEFHANRVLEPEPLEWIGLLQSCTAFEAYCKAYTADLRPDRIAEFLVLNAIFPHSIRFSADALEASLKQIGMETSKQRSARVQRIAGRLQATLAFGQIDEIM